MKNYLLNLWLSTVCFFKEKEAVTTKDALPPLNLQFFAGDPEPESDPEPEGNPKPEDDPDPKTKPDKTVPYSRFDEVNKRANEAEAELQKIKDAEAERVRLAKEKQGEYETLYQEADGKAKKFEQNYETAKEKAKRLEGVVNNILNTKLESIPEEFHELIPENLSPEQKLDWIEKASAKGLFKDKSQEPLGGATNPTQQPIDLDSLNVQQLMQSGYKN